MNKIIHAIQIILKDQPAADASIGLYAGATENDPSEFRLSEEELTLVSGDRFTPLISLDGLPEFSLAADYKSGPQPADYNGFDITIPNTHPLSGWLKTNGVTITGCICNRIEFSGTEADSQSGYKKTLFGGVCEKPKWNESGFVIPVKNQTYKRKALMATIINNGNYATIDDIKQAIADNSVAANYPFADNEENGKCVPLNLGEIDRAKFIRTASKIIPFILNGTTSGNDDLYKTLFAAAADTHQYNFRSDPAGSPAIDYGDVQRYPVVAEESPDSPVTYHIKIALNGAWYDGDTPVSSGTITIANDGSDNNPVVGLLQGMYLWPKEGTGAGKGSRRITNVQVNITSAPTVLIVTVCDCFDEKLTGNANADAENNTWAVIDDVKREYASDIWECCAFI